LAENTPCKAAMEREILTAQMPGNQSRAIMKKITPFLWFDKQAEEAAKFYTTVFKGSKILGIARYTKGTPGKPGSVITVKFRILGQEFTALNGGPVFKFTPAVSFVVHCRSQREIDYYWRRLSAGGKKVQCGWLEDKYGVSWQVVPDVLVDLLTGNDPARAERVMKAVMKMVKLDIKRLRRAAAKK
jgi:predicted 3-demethylubiquinone-9 3-methyltransferase (glyoxalase superfamily)